jgi:hypothetical protein
MKALSRALTHYRPNEREYIAELDGISKKIVFLLDFIDQSPSHRSLYPVVEDLEVKEMLIKRALRRPTLPPMTDELRNPFTRRRTLAKREYIRQLLKDCERRACR